MVSLAIWGRATETATHGGNHFALTPLPPLRGGKPAAPALCPARGRRHRSIWTIRSMSNVCRSGASGPWHSPKETNV